MLAHESHRLRRRVPIWITEDVGRQPDACANVSLGAGDLLLQHLARDITPKSIVGTGMRPESDEARFRHGADLTMIEHSARADSHAVRRHRYIDQSVHFVLIQSLGEN